MTLMNYGLGGKFCPIVRGNFVLGGFCPGEILSGDYENLYSPRTVDIRINKKKRKPFPRNITVSRATV